MYRHRRYRKIRLRVNRKTLIFLAVTFAAVLSLVAFFVLRGSGPSQKRYIEKAFSESFEEISANVLNDMNCSGCPTSGDLADFKNQVLGALRRKFDGILFVYNPSDSFPAILSADADIQGYFTQEILYPAGNLGLFSIKFTAVAEIDVEDEMILEAECIVYQELIKGDAPYIAGKDLTE